MVPLSGTHDATSVKSAERPDRFRLFGRKGFMLLLAALICLSFYDVLFGPNTFIIRDYGIFSYPIAHYFRESFWRGEVPLWNPVTNCGLPFLAQWSTLVLYPPSLIYLVLPLPWSLGLYCLFHLWLAGVGMYALGRKWTGSDLGATVAGLAFVFNGFTLNCLMWPAFLAAIAWMPWIFYLSLDSWEKRKRTWVWPTAAGAMQMLTGAPEVILLTWGPLGLMWLIKLFHPGNGAKQQAWVFPMTAVVVALLAAAQLLPFIDLLEHSQRSANYADASGAMPRWGLANLLVPLFHCYRAPNGVYFQTGQDWTSSYYLGVVVLFLGLYALLRNRDVYVRIFFALSVLCFLLAFGQSSYALLRKLIPALGFMRYPIKFLVFPVFAFPLLAGVGAANLESPRAEGRWDLRAASLVALLGAGITALLLFAHGHVFSNETWSTVLWSGVSRLGLLAAVGGILYAMRRTTMAHFALAAFALLIPLDALTHAPSQNPTVPRSVYSPGLASEKITPTPTVGVSRAFLTRDIHDKLFGRMLPNPEADYLGRRLGLLGNTCVLDGIPNVDGFFSLYLRESRDVWKTLFYGHPESPNIPLADYLGISHYSSPTEFLEWEKRTNYLPMITLGQEPRFGSDVDVLQAISSPEFKPRESIYLPESTRGTVTAGKISRGSIADIAVGAQKLHFSAEVDRPAIVSIAQAYYHNWRAYVDDHEVPLWRANYGFQALEIPAGHHVVRVEYKDRMFQMGLLISGLTVMGCLAGFRKASI